MRSLPMASEVVVGQPQYLRIARLWVWLSRIRVPQLRIPLRNLPAVLLSGILVNKQKRRLENVVA